MVDSCRVCPSCLAGEEQYCENSTILTYNAYDKHLGGVTYGGYSQSIVVDEAFVFRVSDQLNPAGSRRFCARASQPTRRSAIGTSAGSIRSASSGSAASVIWV